MLPVGTHFINRIFPGYNPAAGVYPNWGNVRVINGAILTVDEWNRDTGALLTLGHIWMGCIGSD